MDSESSCIALQLSNYYARHLVFYLSILLAILQRAAHIAFRVELTIIVRSLLSSSRKGEGVQMQGIIRVKVSGPLYINSVY